MRECQKRLRFVAALAAIIACTAALVIADQSTRAPNAQAAVASDFQPGYIISDAQFYNGQAMSAAQVQAFLQSKVSACASGHTCLPNYTQSTPNRAADAFCSAYQGGNQTAAQIVAAVGNACNISQAVLIVLLQKEQGLVTATAPSSSAYTIATGYGCPDTSACDSLYYGFFNQVYSAAHQFERYKASSGYNYQAGRNNTVRWSPNASCGSSTFYINNAATAALYNYTPYRPNAAALANLYGTGDGCSTYGNRNFWRYYTDWFGNPTGGGSLVRTASDPSVYLISGTTKAFVPDGSTFDALSSLGPLRYVADSYLASFTTVANASRWVRDATTGNIYLMDSGTGHLVVDCGQLAAFGGNCSSYTSLTPVQASSIPLGSTLSNFVRQSATGAVWYVANSTKTQFFSMNDLTTFTGGAVPAVTNLSDITLGAFPSAAGQLYPGDVFSTPSGSLGIVQDGISSRPITSSDVATQLARAPVAIDALTASAYPISGAAVGLVVSCGSSEYWLGGGGRTQIAVDPGLGVSALSPTLCAAIPALGASAASSLVARTPGGVSYLISGGVAQRFDSDASLTAFGGSVASTVPIDPSVESHLTQGTTLLAVGSLVKTAANAQVYFIDGLNRRYPVASFQTAAAFGVAAVTVVDPSDMAGYQLASTNLSIFVSCGGIEGIVGGGVHSLSTSAATAAGLAPIPLSDRTCARLGSADTYQGSTLFLRDAVGNIFVVRGGTAAWISDMRAFRMLGGSAGGWTNASTTDVASIPSAAPVFSPGTLIKQPAAANVYFVLGDGVSAFLPSFAVSQAFGSRSVRTVDANVLGSYTASGNSMGIAVSCGSSGYIAGDGKLWPANLSASGLAVNALPAAACSTYSTGNSSATGPVFLREPVSGSVYVVESGSKRFVTSMATVLSLNGGQVPVFIPESAATLAQLTTGSSL